MQRRHRWSKRIPNLPHLDHRLKLYFLADGTTRNGGNSRHCVVGGCGTVFELSPAAGQWKEKIIYALQGGGNGDDPWAGVVFDGKGNLYGTAIQGGNNFGIAFELQRAGSRWKEQMLYNFCSLGNCTDGMYPNGMTFDWQGNLYGTTMYGGKPGNDCGPGCGVIFKLTHTNGVWKQSVPHYFEGDPDGALPLLTTLVWDAKGNAYGTTTGGGIGDGGGYGTVFEFKP